MELRVFLFTLSIVGIAADCPTGWRHHGYSCYLISKSVLLSWTDAYRHCKDILHADLAVIDDRETLNFLFGIINPTHQEAPRGVCQTEDDYWVGGSDEKVEGHWIWVSTSEDLDSNFWCPENPSNSGGNEDCLEFKDGHWNDDNCAKHQQFICEMKYPGDGQNIIG